MSVYLSSLHALLLAVVPGSYPTPEVAIVGAIGGIVIGILGTGATLWRFRKLGDVEKRQMAHDAADKAVEAIDAVLQRYIEELGRALARVRELETDLELANQRIAKLEGRLLAGQSQEEALRKNLEKALRERIKLEMELEMHRHRIDELDSRVGRRRDDPKQGLDDPKQGRVD